MANEPKISVMILSEVDKSKFKSIVNEVIDLIYSKTKNKEDIAYILKILVEGFQDETHSEIIIRKNLEE